VALHRVQYSTVVLSLRCTLQSVSAQLLDSYSTHLTWWLPVEYVGINLAHQDPHYEGKQTNAHDLLFGRLPPSDCIPCIFTGVVEGERHSYKRRRAPLCSI
jgi:hypothetical protein